MQLIEIIQEVLRTGQLPVSLEKQLQVLLGSADLSETEMTAINQLLEALCCGTIRSVA